MTKWGTKYIILIKGETLSLSDQEFTRVQDPLSVPLILLSPVSVRILVKLVWNLSIQENLDSFAYRHLNIVSQLR
jgi:hypothetical protein